MLAIFYFRSKAESPSLAEIGGYQLSYQSCWFKAPWRNTIRCAKLRTPGHPSFELPVVIIVDDSNNHKPDPLVYLTGGPGASARLNDDGIEAWLHWLEFANLGRDLILMDSRGTGGAKPALACAAYNRFNQQLFTLSLPLGEELEQSYLITKHCFEQLAKASPGVQPQNFGTRQSAADVLGLMGLVGYSQWNLLGVSYGTRLALEISHQEMAAREQSKVSGKLRSLVLDSVYPVGYGGVQTWPQVLDDAFAHFFSECGADSQCAMPLADVGAKRMDELFMAVLAKLKVAPKSLTVTRWDGDAPIEFLVNDHRFLSAAFAAVYHRDEWPLITQAMAGVLKNSFDSLLPLVKPYLNNSLSGDFNSLAFMAVDCADNPVGSEAEFNESVARYPLLSEYTRDQWRFQICQYLQQPVKNAQPLVLDAPRVPVLMLAGTLDPITPVTWARDLHSRWPGTQLLERRGVGHGVLAADACILEHLRDFLDSPYQSFAPDCI